MLTKKEAIAIVISGLIFWFIMGFSEKPKLELLFLPVPFIIILTCIFVKKYSARYFNMKIEHKFWEFQRYGYLPGAKLKKPFPIGTVLPFFLSFFSLGILKPLTFLQFNPENLHLKRLLRVHGRVRRTDINESDIANTAIWGFYSLIGVFILSSVIAAYMINNKIANYNFFLALAKYSIYYGFWNLIPVSKLDGARVFFGSFWNWVLLGIIYVFCLIIAIAIPL